MCSPNSADVRVDKETISSIVDSSRSNG